jgi:hypothetical protein
VVVTLNPMIGEPADYFLRSPNDYPSGNPYAFIDPDEEEAIEQKASAPSEASKTDFLIYPITQHKP